MSQYKVFEYIILTKPKDPSVKPVIKYGIQQMVARNEEEARIQAARRLPAEVELDEVEILVRPF